MLRYLLFLGLFFSLQQFASAADIHGMVKDGQTGEEVIGCMVNIKELKTSTSSGLDGSYILKNVPTGSYTLVCSFLGFKQQELSIRIDSARQTLMLNIALDAEASRVGEVLVFGQKNNGTEASARTAERESPNMMNAVSAHTIEISPDLDVANVLKRMSGVTIDKNAGGNAEYAILRGMDKRYSYTLINGIKIPSTNDKHRYVAMNLFPADLVDRVEVTKSLTPDMEGDAIAGAINLVMKNAPSEFLLQANAGAGYSALWGDNPFQTFNNTLVNTKAPYEINGPKYSAKPSDFPKKNLDLMQLSLPVDVNAGLTVGNRFFHKKLGWIVAASYNENYTGKKALIYGEDQSTDGKNLPQLTKMTNESDYNHQKSYGIHSKVDYAFSPNHAVSLYLAYLNFSFVQVRDQESTEFQNNSYDPAHGSENDSHSDRNWFNTQSLFNTTLQGKHDFSEHFSAKWSLVYSQAANSSPNISDVSYYKTYVNYVLQPQYVSYDGSERLWMHNTDEDKAANLDLKYKANLFTGKLELATGGLYRDKTRSSFVDSYILDPRGPVDNHSAKDIDWDTYSEINWTVRTPLGAANVPGTYNAYEKSRAGYGMLTYNINKIRVIGGARYEYFAQGYDEVFHSAFLDHFKPGNDQKRDHVYNFLLPSLNLTYQLNDKNNLKAAYYKAINKPGFYEIVPYNDNTGDYPVTGNPDLRNAVADNLDLRYEYFPTQFDQILVGGFYKKIKDAIEEGFVVDNHGNYNLTYSNSDATNYGFEIDVVKYFREFGIKANYTWTHSLTSSYKRSQVNGVVNRDSTISTLEYRPLYGQAEHVGNISFLYKSTEKGIDAQLAFSYTGKRIYKVSTDINSDYWAEPTLQLDASVEKRFKHIGVFIKVHNILDTHTIVYLNQVNPYNDKFTESSGSNKITVLRDEYTGRSFLIGIRYKMQ